MAAGPTVHSDVPGPAAGWHGLARLSSRRRRSAAPSPGPSSQLIVAASATEYQSRKRQLTVTDKPGDRSGRAEVSGAGRGGLAHLAARPSHVSNKVTYQIKPFRSVVRRGAMSFLQSIKSVDFYRYTPSSLHMR